MRLQRVRSLADLTDADRPLEFPADGSLPEALRTDFGRPDFLADLGHRSGCRYAN